MRSFRAGFGEPTTRPVDQTARQPSGKYKNDDVAARETPRSHRSLATALGRLLALEVNLLA